MKQHVSLILGIFGMIVFSLDGSAQESKTLQGIAFGLSMGNVKILNLEDLSVRSFSTDISRRYFTEGIEYFPDAETLVFSAYSDERSWKIGSIYVPTGEVTYWESEKIGLGRYVLAPSLSRSFPNRVYGRFSETPLREFQSRQEAEEFETATRIGAFDVVTGTWEEVSHDSKSDWMWFIDHIYTLRPDWKEKFQPVWEALLNQNLLTPEAMNDFLWADERYVFFRSGEEFVLGQRDADRTITIVQRIPSSIITGQIQSVAFVYSSSTSHLTTANEYILVSAVEEIAPPIPCQIYRTDTKQQSLSLIKEIPAQKGIRLVSAYPQSGTLAIWRYEEQESGSLLLVDIDDLERQHLARFPFSPISGGYLMSSSDRGLTVVAWAPSQPHNQLYAYSFTSGNLEQVDDVPWEKIRVQGANSLGGYGQTLNAIVDAESGEIFYYAGDFRSKLSFELDEESRQIFQQVMNFPNSAQKWAAIWANNEKHCVIGAAKAAESGRLTERIFVFIYDKIAQHWRHFAVESEGDNYLQTFDDWLIIQKTIADKSSRNAPSIFMGKYLFYHLDSNEQFIWQTDPQIEILGIWDNTILYRREDTLFESEIVGTQITGERVLCRHEAIQSVHWAFLAPFQAISLSTSDSEKEQHSQQVGTYLLAAAQERSEPPMPCTLYRTDAASQTLSASLATIFPHRGIHQVTAHPLYRKLAVWREDDHQTGSLVIVDVDMPAYRQTVSLPFAPTSGGAFLVHEDTPLVLSRAVSARHAEAYTVPLGADRVDRSLTHIQWNTAMLQGANVLRGRRLRSVVVQFEPYTNQLFPFFSDDTDAILPFQFDEVTRRRFESFHTNVADMPGNTARLCALRPYIQNQLPEKFPLLVYDKLTRTWRELAVEGAAFAVQVFGPWIVMQHVMPNQDDPDGLPTPTGDYTFTHLDRETPMHWQADDQTEVLGIWGATLLYRTGETVFEATIDEHDIIDSRPVCRDPAVQHVHWAFRLPSQGGEE